MDVERWGREKVLNQVWDTERVSYYMKNMHTDTMFN
jgi:hypothetical protein